MTGQRCGSIESRKFDRKESNLIDVMEVEHVDAYLPWSNIITVSFTDPGTCFQLHFTLLEI